MAITLSLSQLGWSAFFQQQLSLDEWQHSRPARVFSQHRSHYQLISERGEHTLAAAPNLPKITVGDWLLLNAQNAFLRLLERRSLFSRRASGVESVRQEIAANIDTAFVLCSLNQNFSLNRIERYLAMVQQAECSAVVVLSKVDLCADLAPYQEAIDALSRQVAVERVNTHDSTCRERLLPWCPSGQTVALLGSSGVGKSTLSNTLMEETRQITQGVREGDSKGRHTTTAKQLYPLANGALLMDTPGLRELQIADCEQGVRHTFDDIEQLAQHCRYRDCQHQGEPGCAVRAACVSGALSERRLHNYRQLLREQAHNSASIAEKRAHDRALSQHYKRTQNASRKIKKGR